MQSRLLTVTFLKTQQYFPLISHYEKRLQFLQKTTQSPITTSLTLFPMLSSSPTTLYQAANNLEKNKSRGKVGKSLLCKYYYFNMNTTYTEREISFEILYEYQ